MHPALALLELDSIVAGIRCGDAMVKHSPVEVLHAGTVHPGKYLVLVAGAVAHVDEALDAGLGIADGHLIDHVHLPQVDTQVVDALTGRRATGPVEALGVVETRTAASLVGAADRGVKEAEVVLRELRLADHLGGKAHCLFAGSLTDVDAAVDAAVGPVDPRCLVGHAVIPQLHDEMRATLEAAPGLVDQLHARSQGGQG